MGMRRRFARLVKVREGVVERRRAIALHILRRPRAHPDPVAHVAWGRPGRRGVVACRRRARRRGVAAAWGRPRGRGVLRQGVVRVVRAVVVVWVHAERSCGRALYVRRGGGIEGLVVVREGNHSDEDGKDWV